MSPRPLRQVALTFLLTLLVCAVAAGTASARHVFAPYIDMTQSSVPDLARIHHQAGVAVISLGFVAARGSWDCAPTWGGYPSARAAGRHAYALPQIAALRRAGGQVIPSFGGAGAAELATVCSSAKALAGAYRSVITTLHASRVDFDIEGSALDNRSANTRRARALAQLQREARRKRQRLRVSFTLPVLPTGLPADALAVVRDAKHNGVSLDHVNVMTMDYGDAAAPTPAGRMGALAIRAAVASARQLQMPLSRIGVTPMIGTNDVSSEIFTLADAGTLASWARQHRLGWLAMWSLGRDRACAHPTSSAQSDCSSISQSPWAFAHALGS